MQQKLRIYIEGGILIPYVVNTRIIEWYTLPPIDDSWGYDLVPVADKDYDFQSYFV